MECGTFGFLLQRRGKKSGKNRKRRKDLITLFLVCEYISSYFIVINPLNFEKRRPLLQRTHKKQKKEGDHPLESNPLVYFHMNPSRMKSCYFQSSIKIPLPILKSVTNQVVWIPPPATTTRIAPALEKGLIRVSGEAFKNVAKGSRP